MQAAGKTLFLMTSSYADYAKFILSKILVDENGIVAYNEHMRMIQVNDVVGLSHVR